jgi:hypothetical protein
MSTKRRGNPNWGRSVDQMPIMPVSPSGWDMLLYRLNLSPDKALSNPQVRDYILKHHRNRFVPEKVLEHFSLDTRFFD